MATYSIINFDKQAGQLLVRFHPEMQPLSVDVPIIDGRYLAGEALDEYIKNFIPTWHIERLEAIKNGVSNEAELAALVTPEDEEEQGLTPQATVVGAQTL